MGGLIIDGEGETEGEESLTHAEHLTPKAAFDTSMEVKANLSPFLWARVVALKAGSW